MAAAPEQAPPGLAAKLVAWISRRRLLILALALALGAAGTRRTALSYAALRSDLEELLPPSAPSVAALETMRQRMPALRFLGVVVDTGGPAQLPQALAVVDALAERIRAYPADMVGSVRLGISEERRFIETHALQLMAPEDARELREAIERRRDWEVMHASGFSVLDENEDPQPELPIAKLKEKYTERAGAPPSLPGDRFVSQDGHTVVLVVQAVSHATSLEADRALLGRVTADVAELRAAQGAPATMRVGYAGDVATRIEMMEDLVADISLAGLLAGVLVFAVVWWHFRTPWAMVALGVPLLLGTVYTFGLVALPPLAIRHLNSNTAFFGSVVLGNGINSGIILLARLVEERKRGLAVEPALAVALGATLRPTLAAAAASGTAYGVLVFTDFRGFSQFGWIGAVGMMTCWAANMLLVPLCCLVLGDRLGKAGEAGESDGTLVRWLRAALSRPRLVLGVTLVALLAAGAGLAFRGSNWLEHDFSKLRSRSSFVDGERYWGPRMDATLRQYLTPTVVLTKDGEHARAIATRLREVAASHGAGDLIQTVRTVELVLPSRRDESLVEARKVKRVLTERMRKELKPADRELVDRALSDDALSPLEPSEVPATLMAGFRERDGRYDRTVVLFPRISSSTWEGPRLHAYAADIRAAVAREDPDAKVCGSLLLSADLTDAMGRDGPLAAGLGLAAAFVICALAFGSLRLSAQAMLSVVAGVALMMGALSWTSAKLNFSNFVALPITFGIAADYAINILRRYQAEGGMDARAAIASTAGAVSICSATTIFGFGSLLAAQHPALHSFGQFAATGEVTTLITATLALPAAITLYDRWRRWQARAPSP